MTYRFTVAEKWTDDEWFMELEPAMKCLFMYMCDMCDCCGVWKVNFKQASFSIGAVIDKQSALNAMNDKIIILALDKWFLPSFIKVQYPGLLSFSNSAHRGVIKRLDFHGIENRPYLAPIKTLGSPLVGAKDKDKDKDSSILISSSLKNKSALSIDSLVQLFNDVLASRKIGKIDFCHGLSSNQFQDFITTTSFKEFQEISSWEKLFSKVAKSDFLNGNKGSFVATLNWLVKHDNALKVLNGQYNGTPESQKSSLTAFKSKSHGVTPTNENPTGNPYIQEAIEKGYIA